jgi:hypothetical protein
MLETVVAFPILLTALGWPGSEGFEVNLSLNDGNSSAVAALLADAEHALALTRFEDVRGNRDIVEQTVARARRSYDDLLRRGRATTMSDEERATFQGSVDRLRAALRFFGEAV